MNVHPSVHLDLAREREQELTARAEHRILMQKALCRETRETDRPPSRHSGAGEPSRVRLEAATRSEPTTKPDRTSKATFRELAHRVDGGVAVTLLWSARENRLAVAVFDGRAGELLVLDVESDKALEVFYHPYAHAESLVAA